MRAYVVFIVAVVGMAGGHSGANAASARPDGRSEAAAAPGIFGPRGPAASATAAVDFTKTAEIAGRLGPMTAFVHGAAVFLFFADAAATAFGGESVTASVARVYGVMMTPGGSRPDAPPQMQPEDGNPQPQLAAP